MSEPVRRIHGLEENKQCLKYPGFECNCRLKEEEVRMKELRQFRQKVGAYSFLNMTDPGVAEEHEIGRNQMCEGQPPKLLDRIKNFRIKIV